MATNGAFITLEGIEGVGKSTNLAFIEEMLATAGLEVVITREPGGTPLGEQIRNWVLGEQHGNVSANVETMLMFAARAQHLDEVIRPALERGAWVVCDRFTDATVAYQGGGRGVSIELIRKLRQTVQKGLEPDLTLLFDAPIEVGFSRIEDRERDHFERENREFFERVRASYLQQAEDEPSRIRRIDASGTIDTVKEEVRSHVQGLLNGTTTDA